jgi:hypothetical protein
MTDITTVLLKALADNGPTLGVTIPGAQPKAIPCFFLHEELFHEKKDAIAIGRYSHVKLYKGHYLDYINKNEYGSLEEWAKKYGMSIDNIMFGYNKFDSRGSYITLKKLMQTLCPPLVDPAVEELTKLAAKLSVNGMTVENNILVLTKSFCVQTYTHFMAE